MPPEVTNTPGKATEDIQAMTLVDVWCRGCGKYTKMNSNYAKFLGNSINSCAKCRGLKLVE